MYRKLLKYILYKSLRKDNRNYFLEQIVYKEKSENKNKISRSR